jgi:hypothetical protein
VNEAGLMCVCKMFGGDTTYRALSFLSGMTCVSLFLGSVVGVK